jgi:hypothetical protein
MKCLKYIGKICFYIQWPNSISVGKSGQGEKKEEIGGIRRSPNVDNEKNCKNAHLSH